MVDEFNIGKNTSVTNSLLKSAVNFSRESFNKSANCFSEAVPNKELVMNVTNDFLTSVFSGFFNDKLF